mgnify:CR=1 FL=1
MLNIGCHLSASKGFYHMGKEALSINANTFQFFTRNPRGGKAKDIDVSDVESFLKIAEEKMQAIKINNLKTFVSTTKRLIIIEIISKIEVNKNGLKLQIFIFFFLII